MKSFSKTILWVSVGMVLFAANMVAQDKPFDESILSDGGKQAYQTLLKIKLFAIGGIGYGGKISDGEKAFDTLFDEKESLLAFKSLVKIATLEGGLYGLLGLKINDCDCFNKEYDNYKRSRLSHDNKEIFTTASGCSVMPAETTEDKRLVIGYVVDKGFEIFKSMKVKQREYRKTLENMVTEKNEIKKTK